MSRYIITISLLLISCTLAVAQGKSGNMTGTVQVYSIQSLEINKLSGVISLSAPNDFFNGITVPNYANIKVKSNENWVLSYASMSTYFSPLSQNASTDMPCSVLSIKVNGHKNFKELKTSSTKLRQGNRGSKGSKNDFNIDVHLDPGFEYNGGMYSISVRYTLTKQ